MLQLLFHIAMAAPPGTTLPHIEATAADVALRRELPLLAPVDSAMFTEAELRERIETSLLEDYPADEIRGDAATLVALGFCEPGVDLFAVYREIFVEQIGGFYDPSERRLVLVRRPDGDASMEQIVVEHELVHALQDQSFDLTALDERPFDDSDIETAIHALVEGDASFFNVLGMAGEFVGNISSLPLGNGGAAVHSEPGTALAAAPDILSRSLVFPYIQGAAFVQALHASDGYRAVNVAYRSRPPLSTEQILHPDRYLALIPDWPIAVTLPETLDAGSAWTVVDEDTLGELGMLSWLEAVGGQVAVGTPLGWGGDRYRTYLTPEGQPVLAWYTVWDSPQDAERFATRAKGVVEARHGGSWRSDGSLRTAGRAEAMVKRDGAVVTLVFGAPRRTARSLVSAMRSGTTTQERSSAQVFTRPVK